VCIKIPATPESLVACQYLEKVGIRTLATCLFSVPQAVAASQAGCLYIAPYFNGTLLPLHQWALVLSCAYLGNEELRVHFDPTVWKEYEDTAREHPMSPIIYDIVQTFKAINSKTLVMPARYVHQKLVGDHRP
jgi:transaldolase